MRGGFGPQRILSRLGQDMKIAYITGIPGSGKTTLETNLRVQTGARQTTYEELSLSRDGQIAFIGRTSKKNGKPIKYAGLDAYDGKTEDLLDWMRNLGGQGVKYAVFSGIRDFKKYVPSMAEYGFGYGIFFNVKTPEKILQYRNKRREKSAIPKEVELERIRKEVERLEGKIALWERLQNKHPESIKVHVLQGSTMNRIESVLNYLDRKHDRSLRIIRKHHSERYRAKP